MTTKNEHREPDTPHDRVVPKICLTSAQAAWSLGISERMLRNFVADGILPCVKIGQRTLFDPADLAALRDARKVRREPRN